MRQYGIDHPNVRMKEVLSQDNLSGELRASHEGPFGRKTELYVQIRESILLSLSYRIIGMMLVRRTHLRASFKPNLLTLLMKMQTTRP